MTDEERVLLIQQANEEAAVGSDAIWIYGCRPQNKLADFTRIVANMIADGNSERVAEKLLETADMLSTTSTQESGFRIFKSRKRDEKEKFRAIIKNIDDMAVSLRLQQAQLLKEIKVFEKMQDLLDICSEELEIYIREGEKKIVYLESQPESEDTNDWLESFRKKVDELRTTHIVCMQSQTQVKVLRRNHTLLAEKIRTSLQVLFPLWRNQAIISYGLEQNKGGLCAAERINDVTQNVIRENDNHFRNKPRNTDDSETEVGDASIQNSSRRMEESLRKLADIEHQSSDTCEEMKEIFLKLNDSGYE